MTMMTSAYANKVIRKLNEDKEFWRRKENEASTYVAATDEEPVIPDYDYAKVAGEIAAIDDKILKIKHAINVNNATNRIAVGETEMTIDEILVKMAQLGKRKAFLDTLRKREPKTRINSGLYSSRKTAPEYEYVNYDIELVKKEYERIDAEIAAMQIALDKYNQTFEFEVPV
ncbi:MAG: hypothetical protein K5879_11255 [Lachnospiraceae bacterium]|nr:hypothetical protein [Lachnospiraceae bacterium]